MPGINRVAVHQGSRVAPILPNDQANGLLVCSGLGTMLLTCTRQVRVVSSRAGSVYRGEGMTTASGSTRAQWLAALTIMLSGPVLAAPVSFLLTDAQNRPVQGAVISFAGADLPPEPSAAAEIAQAGRKFTPPVLAVRTGTAVSFPNRDSVRHHVYSFSAPKRFELRLYKGTPSQPIVFDQPGVVVLGCNIHDWMVGYVYVTNDPRFAVSDAQGRLSLDLPPGQYPMTLWHPANADLLPQARGTLEVGAAGAQENIQLDFVAPPLVPERPKPSRFGEEYEKAYREGK